MSDQPAPPAGGREIDGAAAWRNVVASHASRWSADERDPGYAQTAHARLAAGIAVPGVEPKFRFTAQDVFFCIGSCFARNIEEHLLYRGLPVASRSISFGDRNGRPNGVLNKYTPASILNELRWSLAGAPFPQDSFVEEDGAWRDLQLAARAPADSLDGVRERRARVEEYFGRLRGATVAIVTLGLVETWYDTQSGVMLNAAPSLWATRRAPGRFRLIVTDYNENLRTLRQIYDVLARHASPALRVIVTVSPVPLSETFSGQDVIVANAYSKATLRAAAEDSTAGYAGVQYYPSYEAITVSHRSLAYNAGDDLHVLDSAVQRVAAAFLATYGIAGEREHPEFVEMDYLFANPDVHQAVLDQHFVSGYAHWLAHGRAEGRALRARDRPLLVERLVGP